MDEANETNTLVLMILDFLKTEYHKSTTTTDAKESIEVAIQCLETAFNTNLSEQQCKVKTGLREMFRSYNSGSSGGGDASSMFGGQNPFAQFAQILRPGAASTSEAGAVDSNGNLGGAPYELPDEASGEQKAQADEQKNLGNDHMKSGDFTAALNAYNEAIKLDGRNAVYFCNRAAAYQKLNNLDKALRDCEIASQLQPDYARAYGRMGVTYSTLGNHYKAAACYKKAVELEPANESYANNLKVSEEVIASGGGAGAAGAGGFGGGPPSFQSLFNNPSLISMATQMLQDPNMQSMMSSIVNEYQTPNAGEQMNMNGLLQVGEAMANQIRMANPNLVDQLNARLNPDAQPPPENQPPGDPPGNQ